MALRTRVFALLIAIGLPVLPAMAQNPYTLRCDTIDASKYPLLTMRVGVDSLFNPVIDLRDSDFTVLENGRRYVPQFVAGSCSHDSLSVMLVMDQSTSMTTADMGNRVTRLSAAQQAATRFVNRLDMPPDEVGMVTFCGSVYTALNFTKQRSSVTSVINAMRTCAATNLTDATTRGLALLKSRPGKRILLLLTDGIDNTGPSFDQSIATLDATARADSIICFAIGLYPPGSPDRALGEPRLERFAEGANGAYYIASNTAQLLAIYDSIYDRVLRPSCLIQIPTPFCDSGRRQVTLTFRRGRDSDQCSEWYDAPPPPSWCDCPHVVYTGLAPTLSAAYPNPIGASTRAAVEYGTEHEGRVVLTIYNMLGQSVATPVNDVLPAGAHRTEIDAAGLAPGIYFYRLTSGDASITRRLTIIR